MNQFSPSQAPVEGEAPLSGPEEEVASSLVDQIIAFDMEPYLGGPLKDIWVFLQDYPMLFAALLVARCPSGRRSSAPTAGASSS